LPTLAANGIEIAYDAVGKDSDPAILLIMGLGGSMIGWPDDLRFGLAERGFRVIRFDNRDIGRSTHLHALGAPNIPELVAKKALGEPLSPPYMLDDMATDAVALLDGLGVERAHVVGMSMGGMIAQLVALNHPAKVKSLTSIMSTTGRPGLQPADPKAMAMLMTPPKSAAREDRIAASVALLKAIAGPDFGASDKVLLKQAELGVEHSPFDPIGVARQTAAVVAAPARNERLASLSLPVLVVHGTDDPLLPLPHGEDTAASTPGSRLKIIPGFGHTVLGPAAPILVEIIGDWVAEIEARG
jgi:pimeloyl-ACP methyl ester carboxylesterase